MYHRMRTGQEIVPPNTKLPHAANFLHMLLGLEPSQEDAEVIDTTFVLYADHTMNASTFTARIVASTLADMFSAITAAIAALGAAARRRQRGVDEDARGGRSRTAPRRTSRDRLERHEKVMGFGHAVYKTMDPRAVVLKRLSKETGERHGDTSWYEISEAIERTVGEQKGLFPNVDFYAASVYHTLGIPTDLMTPIFAIARMAGWTAHVPRTVRGQPRDPARIGVHRTPRSVVGPDRGAVGRLRPEPEAAAAEPRAERHPARPRPRRGSGAPARTPPSGTRSRARG